MDLFSDFFLFSLFLLSIFFSFSFFYSETFLNVSIVFVVGHKSERNEN